MIKLKLCRLTLLVMLCGAAGGCGTISDVCNVPYFKPSARDTDVTQSQALAQNKFLQSQGCPQRFSPLVGGDHKPAQRPPGIVNPFRALIPE